MIPHSLWFVAVCLVVAAVVGNLVGYGIGRKAGPAIFNRPDSRLFKRSYVEKTHAFFERHGGRAIVLARFVPVVRTFITVTAGVAKMPFRSYAVYSSIGAVIWAAGVTVLGYFLGRIAFIRDNVEVILLIVVLLSVVPMGIEFLRGSTPRQGCRSDRGRLRPADGDDDPDDPNPATGTRLDLPGDARRRSDVGGSRPDRVHSTRVLTTIVGGVVLACVLAGIWVVLALMLRRQSRPARWVTTVLCAINVLAAFLWGTSVGRYGIGDTPVASVVAQGVSFLCAITTLSLLWTLRVRNWFAPETPREAAEKVRLEDVSVRDTRVARIERQQHRRAAARDLRRGKTPR